MTYVADDDDEFYDDYLPDDEDEQDDSYPCPECGKEVYADAVLCPRCGFALSGPPDHPLQSWPTWLLWFAAVAVLCIIISLVLVPCF